MKEGFVPNFYATSGGLHKHFERSRRLVVEVECNRVQNPFRVRSRSFDTEQCGALKCRIQSLKKDHQVDSFSDRAKARNQIRASLDLDANVKARMYNVPQQYVLDEIWRIDEEKLANNPNVTKSLYWRFMLINDGHIVRVMRVLTKGRSKLNVLEDVKVESGIYVPHIDQMLLGQWRRRRTSVVDSYGTVLVHSISWWEETTFAQLDKQVTDERGWDYYDLVHWEIARKVNSLHFGLCQELSSLFRKSGPYWGKSHSFKIGGQVRVFTYEVLSPNLSQYIGPMTSPLS